MSTEHIEILAPSLPESVDEASLLKWHVSPGQQVQQDQLLAEVETDKVVLEVVTLQPGTLTEILVGEGDAVAGGQPLARLTPGEVAATEPAAAAPATPEPAPAAEASAAPAPPVRGEGPAARRRKKTQAAQPQQPQPEAPAPAQPSAAAETPPAAVAQPAPAPTTAATDGVRRVPMTRLRATIARRMLAARQQTAMLTTFNEVDMSEVLAARRRYRDDFEAAHAVRLGFMSFFVGAAVRALHQFPQVNAAIDGDDILMYDAMHIGIAISTERGLVVPVLRNAQNLSLGQIEAAIAAYGEKARSARLVPADLQGGTFTISNGGVFGSLLSTPILNPPQSAILGMHRIQQRPMVIDGEVVVRPMMYLALSYDHRLIDGREAVGFLASIKAAVEDPVRLLLEI